MEALVLIGGFIYVAAVGFFVMDKVDRFIDQGGFLPYWDEEEMLAAQHKDSASNHHDSGPNAA